MSKKLLQLFTTLFLLITATGFNLTASAAVYPQRLQLRITDPYTCGRDITGSVIGGVPEIKVTVDLIQNDRTVKTYTIENLASGSDYKIDTPHKDVPDGKYLVRFSATDSDGNTDSGTYNAEILSPDKCPVLTTVRTGAAKFVRENTFSVFFGMIATASTVVFLIKNKRMYIER